MGQRRADVNKKAEYDAKMNPYPAVAGFHAAKLTKDILNLFKLFLKHKDKITRVTFWGVHDGQSWLNGWPIRGSTNYPLLFDRALNPKPAYYSGIAAAKTIND